MTQAQIDRFVGTRDAATILGVSVPRVHQLARQGRLPFLTTPNGRLFPRAELKQIAKTPRRKGRPPKAK